MEVAPWFETLSEQDLLNLLPPSNREIVRQISVEGSFSLDAAEKLANISTLNMACKGGDGTIKPIWDVFLAEMRTLICTKDKRYSEFRNTQKSFGVLSIGGVINGLSSEIAANLHLNQGVVFNLVTLFLLALCYTGKETLCRCTET